MRARLEREQGARNPLKAGLGGYYDIDFALMYLRLRGAGVFYKVLNTPARIDVIEKMGHLSTRGRRLPARCQHFLPRAGSRAAAGDRTCRGQPADGAGQFEVLTNLVKRWTPEHLHQEPLDVTLARYPAAHARVLRPPVRRRLMTARAERRRFVDAR